jgi:hypothetical protein
MAYFDRGGRRAIDVWHRRAGKDLVALHQTAKMAHQRKAAYWHYFPTLEQGRKAIWEGFTADGDRILDTVFPPALVARRNEQQMMVEFKCGAIWRLMGTDKMESVGAGPAGVVFSEFSLCRPSAWDFVRPMLRENGGWAWFIFTPRGRNHAHKLLTDNKDREGWRTSIQTVRDTGLTFSSVRDDERRITAEEMLQEEREEGMEESLIRQEYLCDFTAANAGAVYGDLMEGLEQRGGLAQYAHPIDGVYTAWDLGFSDATAIWFWRLRGGSVEIIDHYEAHGQPLSHYFDVVDGRGFKLAKHWFPHDARARHLTSGVSIIEQATERWGHANVAIGPSLSLLDGLQAGRWLMQQPEFRIHPRCKDGIDALRSYHYHYDEDKRSFSRQPEHDWSSHTADAFRYLALVVKHTDAITRRTAPKPRPAGATLAQMFEEQERRDSL